MMKKRLEFKLYFAEASRIGLKDRLTSIETRKLRVEDEDFDKIKKTTKDIGQDMLLELQHAVNQLSKVIEIDLTNVIKAEESHDKNYFKFKE